MLKKLIRQLLFIQIISAVAVNLGSLINSYMIVHFLGIDSMSAYGYGAPVLMIFLAISQMLTAGAQILSGRTLGMGDKEGTNAYFSSSIGASIIFSLIGTTIIFLFTDQICSVIGAGAPTPDNTVFYLTKDYLRGFAIGASAFMVQQTMFPFLQMSGGRKQILVSNATTIISNIILCLLNVYIFKMGIFGMGLSYALSYLIGFIPQLIYMIRKQSIFRFKISLVRVMNCLQLIKQGSPLLVNRVCISLLPIIINILLTSYGGSFSVAAYSVINTIIHMLTSIAVGVNAVTLALSSMFYGDKDKKSLTESMRIILTYTMIILTVVSIVMFILARPIVSIFIDDVSAMEITVMGLMIHLPSLIPDALVSATKNFYQGINHGKLTSLICFLQNLMLKAVVAYAAGMIWGLNGIWACFLCGETLTLIFVIIYAAVYNHKFSLRLDDILLISEEFADADYKCYDSIITSSEEVLAASEQALSFCKENGLSNSSGLAISLAIEELGNNIITYGFKDIKNNKDTNIAVRILISKDETLLRIRDNCDSFDPIKYIELHQTDDPSSHIGIRLVKNLVKEITYENSFGLNNLLIKM